MKVVAILGGLGSQMIKYSFFLDILEKCNFEECRIDVSIYDDNKVWNGYELGKIFGISDEYIINRNELEEIIEKMNFCEHGKFVNKKCNKVTNGKLQQFILKIRWALKYYVMNIFFPGDKYSRNYLNHNGITYFGEFNHLSDTYLYKNKKELRKIFNFPEFKDENNISASKKMLEEESVAIHVRRSDHMYDSWRLFARNYYNKAVDYISNKSSSTPHFYIFSEDTNWCQNNLDKLGLTDKIVTIVDWNKDAESYRDMQLMTYCKHNILAYSTFSWWGYYLSRHEEKIVIAPHKYWLEVPIHM